MIQLLIEIDQDEPKSATISCDRIDEDDATELELDYMNDIYDLLEYYVYGEDIEDTIDDITKNMKNQNDKSNS